MRVLIVSPDELREPMGGLGEHVREVAKHLVGLRDDIQVDIVEPVYADGFWELVPDKVRVYGIHQVLSSVKHINRNAYESIFRFQTVYLSAILRTGRKYDLIHAQDWSAGDAVRVYRDMVNLPLVTTVHLGLDDLLIFNPNRHHMYFPQAMQALRDMQDGLVMHSHVLCHISRHYEKKFGSRAFQHRDVFVGNGIDTEPWIEPLDCPYRFPGKRPKKLVYIGRFAAMKNIAGLLNARLPDDVDLCLVGCEKGCDSDIYAMACKAEKQRDNIHLLGPLYGQDKIRCMKSAWAGIFPSIHEPFGIVGLEWMASRRPMIASFVEGMNEYLTDNVAIKTGLSPLEISSSIHALASMDEQQIATMTEAAWQRAQLFSWRSVAQRTLDAYERALDPSFMQKCLETVAEPIS